MHFFQTGVNCCLDEPLTIPRLDCSRPPTYPMLSSKAPGPDGVMSCACRSGYHSPTQILCSEGHLQQCCSTGALTSGLDTTQLCSFLSSTVIQCRERFTCWIACVIF